MSKKILCVCDWGEVRSVGLANMIKDLNKISSDGERLVVKIIEYESIPIGVNGFSDESIKYFCGWADKIICLSKTSQKKIESLNYKPLLFEVGNDIWGNPEHYGLKSELKPLIDMIRAYGGV